MIRTVGLCGFTLVAALTLRGRSVAAQSLGDDRMQRLYAANDLDVDGHPPFRLNMTFQLYSLNGRPSEQGTIEMYGAPGGKKHLVVHAPSLKENGAALEEDSPVGAREAYLVSELIAVALNPVPKPGSNSTGAQEVSRQFGKVVLECVSPHTVGPASQAGSEALYCTEATKDAVRYLSRPGGMEAVSRNSMGVFHETNVGLALEIDFAGHPAISAKITTLESVDPAMLEATEPADAAKVSTPAEAGVQSGRAKIAGGVIVGSRTKFVPPEYPLPAKMARLSGTVLLRAVIGKDGGVKHLVPIASTDSMFTDAAIAAVSKWTYRPYLLNGEPVEVDTTITVNFALRQ